MTDPTPITPDEAIATLCELADIYEDLASRERNPDYSIISARRAAAIRWILTLTAYGVDHDEITI